MSGYDLRTETEPLELGGWSVLAALDVIERDGERRKLEPRVMRVLLCLLSKPGEVVTRQELLDTVWPDVTVSEEALTQAVSAIRKALDDPARDPRFIRTIPKRGYQLIAASQTSDRVTPRALRLTAAVAGVALITATVGIALVVPREAANHSRPEQRHLTSYPGRETDPAISSDGRLLAFIWNGSHPDLWNIYLRPMDRETPVRLTNSRFPESSPTFSPTGDRVAFIRHGSRCEVVVRTIASATERIVSHCSQSGLPRLSWSPRGDLLAISDAAKQTGEHELFVIDPESGTRRALTSVSGIMGDRYPAFSPDGSTVAFVRTTAMGASDLWLVPVTGGRPRSVTSEGRWIHGVTWLNRNRLLFSSNRSGRFELWSLELSGGEIRWAGVSARSGVRPSASKDGSYVFEQQNFDSDLFLLQKGSTRTFARSTLWEDEPRWSPDGSRVAFISERSGSREVWISDANGSNPIQVTRFVSASVRSPRWSPDGRSIAVAASAGKSSSLWTIDVRTRKLARLTRGAPMDVAPAWSLDGERLFFSSNRDGKWGIWRITTSGGSPQRIAPIAAGAIFEGPDGDLYFNRPDVGGIWRLKQNESDARVVVPNFGERDFANWELTGASLWYLDRVTGALIELNLKSGRSRRVADISLSEDDIGITISPGGEILHARGNRGESDVMSVRGDSGL